MFLQSLEAVRWSPKTHLIPVLRCLRRTWAAVIADPGQPAGGADNHLAEDDYAPAAAAIGAGADAGSSPDDDGGFGSSGNPQLAAAAWAVSRALWAGLKGLKKKNLALCAAFVNTALLEQLFVNRRPEVQALHAEGEAAGLSLHSCTYLRQFGVNLYCCHE